MPSESRYLTFGGKKVIDPSMLMESAARLRTPDDFVGRANSYYCPVGPEPGVAWILLRRKDLDKLDVDATHELLWTDDVYKTKLKIKKLYIVNAVSMSLLYKSDKDAAYLVECADVRRIFRMIDINASYNVRVPAPIDTASIKATYYPESRNAGSDYTWQTMINDMWSNLISGYTSAPTLPYTPDDKPENYRFFGVNCWEAIHEVLAKIGCTSAYNPLTDAFSIVQMQTASDGLLGRIKGLRDRLMWDSEPKKSHASNIPEAVNVYFTKAPEYYGTQQDTVADDKTNWEMDAIYSKNVLTNVEGAVSGTTVALWDDLTALEVGGTVSNSAALDTRAAEVADEYVQSILQSIGRKRLHYGGLVKTMLPDSQVSDVRWRDYGDADETGRGGLQTEVIIAPGSRLAYDAEDRSKRRGSGLITLGGILTPAGISNAIRPSYPNVCQTVQVWQTGTGDLVGVQANSEGLIPGRVVRHESGNTLVTDDACWIRYNAFHPGLGNAKAGLPNKEYYVGRLYGSESWENPPGTDNLWPIYLVEEASKIYAASSTSSVATDGSVSATIKGTGPSVTAWLDWGDVMLQGIDVFDASVPAEFFVYWDYQDNRWRILNWQRHFFAFWEAAQNYSSTGGAGPGGGRVDCDINDPLTNAAIGSNGVDGWVHDPTSGDAFAGIVTGDEGVCIYQNGYWWLAGAPQL